MVQKIIVIGSCGAGKSTFARKLSAKLNIKLFHLDQLFWRPNWVATGQFAYIWKQAIYAWNDL